jgi:hypothetical protein
MSPRAIKLSRRYESHGRIFDTVSLRDPKYRDLLAVGDPIELQPLPSGAGEMVVKYLDRIEDYVGRLLQDPLSVADLVDLDLVDAMAIEEAILGFFAEARKSRAKPTGSSSGSGNPSTSSPA